ncbi:MAG: dTDP-4-dehydrorhamnose reductase [Syntrophorhabdaceae bacterium]
MIWLIGNKGMLGREVEALLKKKELSYVATDQEIDITNLDELRIFSADKPISWIINCAAYTAVDKAEDETDLAFKINADGPCNIAEIAKIKGAKLIHISTDYVFDGTKTGAYLETDLPNPLGVYGKSKYQGEVYITETLNEYFVIRTSWLYGKQGNNFVYTMLRLFAERDEVRVVCDQCGSPTYAPDLAVVILEIVSLNSNAYGVYHFTNAGKISWHDFACEIYRMAQEKKLLAKEVFIQRIVTEDYPTKAQRPQNSYLSKDKILKTFSISPRNWEAALNEFMLMIQTDVKH